jgi:hypothetical protein
VTRNLPFAILLLLAACAKSEEASLVPPQEDDGYNLVQPVSTLANEGDLAVGEWASSRQDDRPVLQFGPPATEPLFSLACDEGGGLQLQRHGVIAGPGMNQMQVEAGGGARRLTVSPVEGPLPMLRGSVPADGELIGELSSSTDRITVRIGDGEGLVMPSSPLLGEFIRSCPASRREAAAETDVQGNVQGNAAAPAQPKAPTPSARTPG